MLDRYGWPLEIGDPVTIIRTDEIELLLLGARGIVVDAEGGYVCMQLDLGWRTEHDEIISIRPEHLEYGHNGPAYDTVELARAISAVEVRSISRAVEAAVGDGSISESQAELVLTSWRRKRSARSG